MERRQTRTGEEARAPLEQPVGLRFKHFGDFIEKLASNVSTGGMFIRTRRPHPVGSVFEFQLRLGYDRPLIAGKAQVAWVRRRSQYLDQPAGMGVRFVELGDDSRRHIAEVVATHDDNGGQPVPIEPPAPSAAERETSETPTSGAPVPVGPDAERIEETELAAVATPEPEVADSGEPEGAASPDAGTMARLGPPLEAPTARPEAVVRRPGASRLAWTLTILALAVALLALFWRWPSLWSPRAGGAASIEPIAAAALSTEPSAGPGRTGEEPEAVQVVKEWARSWSEQRVDDYLDAYSPRFQPPGELDVAVWARQRRTRILAPQWIQVRLAFVELEETSPDTGRVRFVQVYDSDSYRDVVRKVLDLEHGEGGWKILRETVEP